MVMMVHAAEATEAAALHVTESSDHAVLPSLDLDLRNAQLGYRMDTNRQTTVRNETFSR